MIREHTIRSATAIMSTTTNTVTTVATITSFGPYAKAVNHSTFLYENKYKQTNMYWGIKVSILKAVLIEGEKWRHHKPVEEQASFSCGQCLRKNRFGLAMETASIFAKPSSRGLSGSMTYPCSTLLSSKSPRFHTMEKSVLILRFNHLLA